MIESIRADKSLVTVQSNRIQKDPCQRWSEMNVNSSLLVIVTKSKRKVSTRVRTTTSFVHSFRSYCVDLQQLIGSRFVYINPCTFSVIQKCSSGTRSGLTHTTTSPIVKQDVHTVRCPCYIKISEQKSTYC